MKRVVWLILIGLMGHAQPAGAQPGVAGIQNRFSIGGDLGLFRISHEDFSKVYGGRLGITWSGRAFIRVSTPYNIIFKYRQFSKSNDYQENGTTLPLEWHQKFYNVGVRYMAASREGMTNYFSFGFTFISIEEKGGRSIFISGNEAEREKSPSGFFLDIGLEYRLRPRFSLITELEISSAGLEGKSSFEGSSVGGFYFAVGLAYFIF